jgi:indole-3-glycerol phosphate synthase
MNILEKIVADKRVQVEENKKNISVSELEHMPLFNLPRKSMVSSLRKKDASGIITEFKRRSPSKGLINGTSDVLEVTAGYCANGASGISILTDEKYFGGSNDDIIQSRPKVQCPILRKEFIVDEFQILEARAIGADVILLIAACLTPGEVKRLAAFAKSLELEVLLELHDEDELNHIAAEADMIGVNNRSLKTFVVDINQSKLLCDLIRQHCSRLGFDDKLLIAESGISAVETVLDLKRSGFHGFLMGENFMKEKDPSIAFASFAQHLKSGFI